MSFKEKPNPLTEKLNALDHQVKRTAEPLPVAPIIWVVSGSKGSGKSTVVLNALKHHYRKKFDKIFLISPTAQGDSKFRKLVRELEDDGRVFSDMDEETLQSIIEQVEGSSPDELNCIIFDDCLSSFKKTQQKSLFHKLTTTCRHLRCMLIITTQRYRSLPTLLRANTDVVSFFPTQNRQEYRMFKTDMNTDDDLFDRLYEYCCDEPNSFLHVSLMGGVPRFYRKFNEIQMIPE